MFKKWKHDVEPFIETIGPSWKGVHSILRTSRHLNTEFIEGVIPEMRTLKTKHEPDALDLEYGFDFFWEVRRFVQALDAPPSDHFGH